MGFKLMQHHYGSVRHTFFVAISHKRRIQKKIVKETFENLTNFLQILLINFSYQTYGKPVIEFLIETKFQ